MRLIDADALIKSIDYSADLGGELGKVVEVVKNYAKYMAQTEPTIKEQKTGKWMHGREIAREMIGDCITAIFYEGWKCSECECVVEEEREPLWNYCPNCGAKMRGEL